MTKYRSLISINLSVFLIMLGVGMIVALLPQKVMALSGSVSTVGLLASAFAVTYVLAQAPIGHLSDKIGFKKLLIAGYVLCSLTGLLYLFAGTAAHILAGRFLQGLGEAPLWALAPALLSLQYANNKGKAIGFYNASLHLGLCLGPLLGMLLVRTAGQINSAFLFFAVVSFAGGLLVFFFVDEPHTENNIERFKLNKMLLLLSNRRIFFVLSGITLYGAAYGLAITIIPAFLLTSKGFNQAMVSLLFTIFYVAISLSQLVAGPFSDRKGRRGAMVWGIFFAAAGLFVFSSFNHPLLYLFIAMTSFGLGMFSVASMAYLNESVSVTLKGTISGTYYLFWGLGYFLGPLAAGFTGETFGLTISFYILAGLFSVEAVLLMLVFMKKQEIISTRGNL